MRRFLLAATIVICNVPVLAYAGLLSLYTFDGTADNAVQGAPNGILVGSLDFVAGKLGQAIRLDGSTQYLDASIDGFPKSSAYGEPSKGLWTGSAAFWIKTTSSALGGILAGVNHDVHTAIVLSVNEGHSGPKPGQLSMYFRSENNRSSYHIELTSPNNAWRDGRWHHIVMTWSQTVGPGSNDYTIYIDGVRQPAHGAITGAGITPDDVFTPWQCPVRIGASGRATPTDFFGGSLDDVAVFNAPLSATEARALFNLANDAVLHYNAKDAGALCEIFAAGPDAEGDTTDGRTWSYVRGLSGKPGDVVNDHTALILNGSGDGVACKTATERHALNPSRTGTQLERVVKGRKAVGSRRPS